MRRAGKERGEQLGAGKVEKCYKITDNNLLYSTGNCYQYSIMTRMGREAKKTKESTVFK